LTTYSDTGGAKIKSKPIILFGFVFLVLISSITSALTQDAYQLYFSLRNGILQYHGVEQVNTSRINIERNIGDWHIQIFDNKKNVIFQKRMTDPRIVHYDNILEDGSFSGGVYLNNDISFSLYTPIIENMAEIRIIKKPIARNNREGIQNVLTNTPENYIEVLGECSIDLSLSYIHNLALPTQNVLKIQKIVDNGPDENRIVILIFPYEYEENEIGKFHNEVYGLLFGFQLYRDWYEEGLFALSPIKEFSQIFNVYSVDIVNYQNESQSSFSLDEFFKNYFHSLPDIYCGFDQDLKYAGLGGGRSVTLHSYFARGNVFSHELGHTDLGGHLTDEYDHLGTDSDNCNDPPPEPATWPNVITYRKRASIPWKDWILSSTPIPTPESTLYNDIVGAFEGARHYKCHYFRPQLFCRMKSPIYDFCKVCREYFTINILTNYIDFFTTTFTNASGSIDLNVESSLNFEVDFDNIIFSSLNNPKLVWLQDGVELHQFQGDKNLNINADSLASGPHSIEVKVLGDWHGIEGYIKKDFVLQWNSFQFPIFWILYPPANFSVNRVQNRSLSQEEYIDLLSWEVNQRNENSNIEKYRIYTINQGKKNKLVDLKSNEFEYKIRFLKKDTAYTYAISSVDSEGREGFLQQVSIK